MLFSNCAIDISTLKHLNFLNRYDGGCDETFGVPPIGGGPRTLGSRGGNQLPAAQDRNNAGGL